MCLNYELTLHFQIYENNFYTSFVILFKIVRKISICTRIKLNKMREMCVRQLVIIDI
jgi:hypothetical protein